MAAPTPPTKRQPQRRTVAARRVTATPAKLHTFAARRLLRPLTRVTGRTDRTVTAAEWQTDAWDLFDQLGVIKYPVQYKARVAAKCRLYAAVQPEPDKPPIPVDDPDAGVTDDLATAAVEQMGKLKGPFGGTAEIIRCAFINLDIPGEFILLGQAAKTATTPDGEDIPESWQVRSVEEIEAKPSEGWWKFVDDPARRSLDDDSVNRVWTPHPRKYEQADSPMRAELEDGETLLAFKRLFRASAKSRLPAGLGLLPDSLTFGPVDPTRDGAGDGEGLDDPFDQDLMDAIFRAVEDEGAPSSIAPIWVRGKKEELDAARVLDFGRKVSKEDLEIVKAITEWLAVGLDVPPEIVTGLAGVNHWTGWLIDDSSFRNHLEPTLVSLCDAFTTTFLQAELVKQGHDPEQVARLIVWYDESEAVINPSAAASSIELRKLHVVTDEYVRRAHGVGEDAAPDEAELARQVAADGASSPTPADAPSDRPMPEMARDADIIELRPGLVAAAGSSVAELGPLLARIDRDLRTRLEAAVEAAALRALERAGTQARNKNPVTAAAAKGIPAEAVLAHLGPATLEANDLEAAALLRGQFDYMHDEFRRRVENARAAAYAAIGGFVVGIALPLAELVAGYTETAWRHLVTGLEARLTATLGTGRGVNFGGLVREALSLAGGASTPNRSSSVALGAHTFGDLRDHGIEIERVRWEWAPGDLGGVFEPHHELDGLEAAHEGDVVFGGYAPGDVNGCNCNIVPILVRTSAASDTADIAEE